MANTQRPVGRIEWIGLRPDRGAPMAVVDEVLADCQDGLVSDRFAGGESHRQVTLFQMEYLDAIAKLMGLNQVRPEQTRRNLGVAGVNLHSLIDSEVEIGECVLKITGDCPPCGRMEKTIGPGAIAAMTGLAGVTATVIRAGKLKIGDPIRQPE